MAESLRGREIFPIVSLGAVLWVLWVTSRWIANGDFRAVVLGGLFFAVGMLSLAVLKNWRSGFYLFLVWLLFEDVARKYMGNGTVFFFGKDVLLAIVCASFLLEQRRRPVKLFRPPFLWSLALFGLLAVAQVFNPNSPSIVYGLLGLKLYFYYIPLMFLGYALIREPSDLDRFVAINMVLASIIAGLGIVQAIRGPGFLNPAEMAPELSLAGLGRESPITHLEILRPSSVFVSTGRYTAYLIPMFILGFGSAVYSFLRGSRSWRLVLVPLSIVMVAAFMGGSRGCAVWVAFSAIILSVATRWGTAWLPRKGIAIRKIMHRTLAVLVVGLCLAAVAFPERLKAYFAVYSETLDPRNPESDLIARIWSYPLDNLISAFSQPNWLLGNGTGTASLGGQYVARLLGTRQTSLGVEEGFGTLMLELGILAPLLWLWWTVSAASSCLKTALKTKRADVFPLAFALWWYVLILLVLGTWGGMAQYQNFLSNAYVWLFIGILFRLPALSPLSRNLVPVYGAELPTGLVRNSDK